MKEFFKNLGRYKVSSVLNILGLGIAFAAAYAILVQVYYDLSFNSSIKDADRIVLTPKDFTGGCVKVTAAGKTTILGWDPYEADVTEAYRAGMPIDVTVEGTRTNVFGPLHEVRKPAWACGPDSFLTGGDNWTDNYSLLSSGVRGFIFKAQKLE